MKGTARRGRTTAEYREQSRLLRSSSKEQAENLMIVDLLRNDLGRVAEVGSVTVDDLFALERYPIVWQMTSQVSARVLPGTGLVDLFRTLFPCGSVTGAPKRRTMELIGDLEPTPRGSTAARWGSSLHRPPASVRGSASPSGPSSTAGPAQPCTGRAVGSPGAPTPSGNERSCMPRRPSWTTTCPSTVSWRGSRSSPGRPAQHRPALDAPGGLCGLGRLPLRPQGGAAVRPGCRRRTSRARPCADPALPVGARRRRPAGDAAGRWSAGASRSPTIPWTPTTHGSSTRAPAATST